MGIVDFECNVPLAAEDRESALYLAGVILQGHVAPKLPPKQAEPEAEEAPVRVHEGSKAKPAGKGRVSPYAPDLR